MVKILTREEILSADDLKIEEVHVPEWGGTVRVRSLTGEERDQFEGSFVDKDGERGDIGNLRARLASLAIVDAAGNRLFTFEEAKILGRKSSKALLRVFERARKLAGLRPSDMEEMVENLDVAPSSASSSD